MIGPQAEETRKKIEQVGRSLTALLLEKNKRYGNSALSPPKVFSKQDAGPSIAVRLDDKLGRVANSDEPRRNDVADLIGYLMLYCVSQGWLDFSDLID